MHSSVLSALSLLAAPLLAAAEAQPYLRRAMGADEIFGLSKRQTSGYEPGSTTCSGSGTCAEACGAGYETCGTDFCYLPASQVCCSATSEACDDGYYCTVDNAGNPWCCPNGEDLTSCAALYGVTGLSSVAVAAATSSSAAVTSPSGTTTTSSSSPANHVTTSATKVSSNSTITTATVSQFTGAADSHAVGGLALPLMLAGAIAAL